MAYTPQEVANLYGQHLQGATPTQADINYWTNYGGDLNSGFMGAIQNDPRYGGNSGGNPVNQNVTPEQIQSTITGAIEPLNTGITGLGGKVDTGFTATNNNLQAGFQGVNQNLQSGIGSVNTNIGNLSSNIGTGFNSLNQANEDRATAQTTQATDYFNQLKGLSGGLKDQVTGLGTNLNTYYADLAKTGAGIQSAVDTVGSDLGNFQQDYTKRTNVGDQKRAEILDSVAGTAANNRQAMSQGFNQVGQQISGLGGQPQQAPQPQGGQQQGQGGNFANALNNARAAVANPQNMNPAMTSQLSEFVSAFDQNGQLIQQGPDGQGVMTYRNLGPDGSLQIAKQTQQGMQFVGALNLNQLIQQFGGA